MHMSRPCPVRLADEKRGEMTVQVRQEGMSSLNDLFTALTAFPRDQGAAPKIRGLVLVNNVL